MGSKIFAHAEPWVAAEVAILTKRIELGKGNSYRRERRKKHKVNDDEAIE